MIRRKIMTVVCKKRKKHTNEGFVQIAGFFCIKRGGVYNHL